MQIYHKSGQYRFQKFITFVFDDIERQSIYQPVFCVCPHLSILFKKYNSINNSSRHVAVYRSLLWVQGLHSDG